MYRDTWNTPLAAGEIVSYQRESSTGVSGPSWRDQLQILHS